MQCILMVAIRRNETIVTKGLQLTEFDLSIARSAITFMNSRSLRDRSRRLS